MVGQDRIEQPHFKEQSYSKIVPQPESLNQQTQWVSYPFFFYFLLFLCSVENPHSGLSYIFNHH